MKSNQKKVVTEKMVKDKKRILKEFGIAPEIIESCFDNKVFKTIRELDCFTESMIRLIGPIPGEEILDICFLAEEKNMNSKLISDKLNMQPLKIDFILAKFYSFNKTIDDLCDITDRQIEEMFFPQLKKQRGMALRSTV